MKIFKTKKMAAVFFLAFMICCGMLPAVKVRAAAPKVKKVYKVWLYTNAAEAQEWQLQKTIMVENWTKKGKVTKVKNTNPEVAEVTKGYGGSSFVVRPKAEGTAKVTFRYAGKKLSTKIIVRKYESPCEEFKIGNKDYADYFEKSEGYCLGNRKKDISAKIHIKPKKGWKLQKIHSYREKLRLEKIKNNSRIRLSVKGLYTQTEAYFKNKKTGEQRKLTFLYSDNTVWRQGNIYYRYD